MVSIRLFLTLTLIAILVMVSFLSSLRGYRQSMLEAERLFDLQLLEHARLLSLLEEVDGGVGGGVSSYPVELPAGMRAEDATRMMLAYQVFDGQGNLLLRSANIPSAAIMPFSAGYADTNFGGYRWRSLALAHPEDARWVIVAQRHDVRYSLAESVILEAVIPTVLSIPVAGIFIWFIVGWGLRPIRQLARQVHSREATDLSDVRLEEVPRELTPLTRSTNDLLRRLHSSFEREKRFAADAAHELRTPISVLKVQVHNLLRELDDPRATLEELRLGIDALGRLVEQILLLNRTAPDQYIVGFSRVDLHALAKEVVSNDFDQFLKKDQSFELDAEPAWLQGDILALRSLMQNILSNASKYTPVKGRIRMEIRQEEGAVVLQLEDSGPGVPETHYERVFDRFYRMDGDRHGSGVDGSGLGLAIVKHIVEMHGASVNLSRSLSLGGLCTRIVFSSEGSGSTR